MHRAANFNVFHQAHHQFKWQSGYLYSFEVVHEFYCISHFTTINLLARTKHSKNWYKNCWNHQRLCRFLFYANFSSRPIMEAEQKCHHVQSLESIVYQEYWSIAQTLILWQSYGTYSQLAKLRYAFNQVIRIYIQRSFSKLRTYVRQETTLVQKIKYLIDNIRLGRTHLYFHIKCCGRNQFPQWKIVMKKVEKVPRTNLLRIQQLRWFPTNLNFRRLVTCN